MTKDKTISIEPMAMSRVGDVMLIYSVSTTGSNKYPVRVANLKPTNMWLKPNSRIGIIREVNCLYSQEADIEFFKTDDNEETLVLKSYVDGTNTESMPLKQDVDCSEIEKRKIPDLVRKHSDVFTSNDLDIGYTTTMKHKIKL